MCYEAGIKLEETKRATETILGQPDGGIKVIYRCWECGRLLSISYFPPGIFDRAQRNIGITETLCTRSVVRDNRWRRCGAKNDIAVRINFFDESEK